MSDNRKKPPMNLSDSNIPPNEDIEELKAELGKFKEKYQSYKTKYQETRAENKDLKEKNASLSEELEKNSKEMKALSKKQFSKSCPDNGNSLHQYDLVIHIDSLACCNQKGWELFQYNANDIKEWSKVDQIAIGVIGRENLGKTWIVNKICKENFPSGFYNRTEGLSVKYCHEEQKKLKVMLDSAGMNSAIFFYNEEQKQKYMEAYKMPDDDDDNKIKKLMINDRRMTEFFIQNIILYSCNIILIVVELLTQHDQKIIERIKNLYYNKKMIIVIHNYFNLESKSQVIKRAKEEIMGAFDVVDRKIRIQMCLSI